MEWMLMPLRRYAEFSGRSRRMEFWMFQLLNVIVILVLCVPIFASIPWTALADPEAAAANAAPGPLLWVGVSLLALWWLAVLIPSIAVTVRRLHDRDMSGWWYLGFIVVQMIPYVGWIASIAFIVIMALPGTPGENRFGPDPLGRADAEVFA